MDYDYVISEINVSIRNLERLKRGLEQERDASKQAGAPRQVEYDRGLLDEPPRAVEPRNEPAHPPQGDTLEIDAESLQVADDGERKTFRVKGGAYKKWGVFIWPEVLERDFGINSESIRPGLHPFKYRVRVLMDGDKPRKVVGLA